MTCDWRATTSRAVSSNSRDRPPATQSRHLDFAEIRKSNHPEFHFVGLQLRRCHRSVMGPVARSFTPLTFYGLADECSRFVNSKGILHEG